eukprot:CAMPEP_0204520740 /NCGR_PEP_ID=MMETSP0661-20131031/5420_1 /ASSEMBLY_ACC=CAM_ASM_000606 /TAXON_ID=109239 /ORGANISM="Alexandrium margalefi, Strain AMGDE01CS-322" /LENGTH=225 /DNA_ID=CAMNT_0051526309 /DNA_START=62 /DNA_END=736 /DNA_ORIENTATION=-
MTLNEEQALEQLESFTIPEKKAALQSLVNLGKALQYSDEVAKLLDDEDAPVRKEAALTLGICKPSPGKEAQQIARTLADSLMDDDKTVRAEVARAIAQLGKDGATVADRLEKILGKEKDDEPAMAAIECLSAIGEVTRLSAFIGHSSPNVVRVALVEAGRSPEAARAKFAPLIRDRLGHQDTSVRLAAAQASGELGSVCNDDHLQALADLAADRQVKVRRAAVQA